MHREERELRLVHRIEAFSDVVIGFSLALLALTLVIPNRTIDLIDHPSWMFIYFWTFAVVAAIWWNHQRIFSSFFRPTRLAVFLNFMLLAIIGLVVFFVQVFGHVRADADKTLAFQLYWVALALEFAIIGTLYALGVRGRADVLDDAERAAGRQHAVRGWLLAVGALIGVVWMTLPPAHPTMELSYRLVIPIVIGAVAARFVVRSKAVVHA